MTAPPGEHCEHWQEGDADCCRCGLPNWCPDGADEIDEPPPVTGCHGRLGVRATYTVLDETHLLDGGSAALVEERRRAFTDAHTRAAAALAGPFAEAVRLASLPVPPEEPRP